MRFLVIDQDGLQYTEKDGAPLSIKEHNTCSCSKSKAKATVRSVFVGEGRVHISLSDREYVALVLRKEGSPDTMEQINVDGISVIITPGFMVLARYVPTLEGAKAFLDEQPISPNEEYYIVSRDHIRHILRPSAAEEQHDDNSKIFLFESASGDVFAPTTEYYSSGETITSEVRSSNGRNQYYGIDAAYQSWCL